MTPMPRIADTPAFLGGRDSILPDLPVHMRTWDLYTMLTELEKAIDSTESKNKLRTYARNYLSLSGDKHRVVRTWFENPATLTEQDVRLVLRGLAQMRKSENRAPEVRTIVSPARTVSVNRTVVHHFITLLNSFRALAAEASLMPADAFDGDRMQIQGALEDICKRLGVNATFSDSSASLNTRVTRADLADASSSKGQTR